MTTSEELTGRTLGDFIVRHRIGEGGFGAVYRAEQTLLGREAVIKVLHARHRQAKTVIQRFLREARLASKLDHPYAAHIYAFGVEQDGLMWIAMEYVKGQTLHDILRRGPMSLDELVPLLDRICEVLQTAHDLGIVHRDIKPANVMVVQRAGRAFPKLLDFGVAKLAGDDQPAAATPSSIAKVDEFPTDVEAVSDRTVSFVGRPGGAIADALAVRPASNAGLDATQAADPATPTEEDAALTEAGAAVGSPPYMAPEQWDDASAVTSRSDLYALGIMMFEALTGGRPFMGPSVMAIALAHNLSPVPSLGDRFPAALDAVMQKALAKKPADRYASAMELAQAFRTAAGFGSQPLPVLDDDLRLSVETSFPQPIAEAVAAFHAARNIHQGRDALRDIATTAIRYVALVALAAHAQVRTAEPGSSAIAELLRELRRRVLPDDEWLRLARELVASWRERPQAHSIPELVTVLHGPADPFAAAIAPASADPDPLATIIERLPAVTRLLRALTFLADVPLVVVADGRAESWMGVRRPRRVALEIHGRAIDAGEPVLVDVHGRPLVVLWPIVQTSSPMPGARPELFLFDGRGQRGARLLALPQALERQDERVWDWLGERFALHDRGTPISSDSQDARPYRGLASFTTEDANRFVGREREVDAAINRLKSSALVAVVGPSGAGKSSFVHAGVLPSLPEAWTRIVVRPGDSPFRALELRLKRAGLAAMDLATRDAALGELLRARDQTTVLVIDQFEELFTLGAPVDERRAYVRALLAAAQGPDDHVRVVLTLRDDFLARAIEIPELRDRLPASLFLLGTPARDDLIRILTAPLVRQGFDFDDPTLPGRMVDDLADTPGALALLSFTASKLWELRDRHFRQLTRKAYDGLGGVAGALAQHAETTLGELPPHEQQLARTALGHLVTAEGTRAALTHRELDQLLRDPGAGAVIEKLVAARLLVATESEGGEDRIELVHETLLVAWPRLAQWRRDDAEGARLRDQVRAAARQWIERDRPRGLLWRDDALAELQRWRARHPQPLTDAEEAFVGSSLGEARRGLRLRRRLIAVAAAITAVFVVVTWRAKVAAQASAHDAYEAKLQATAKLRDSKFEEGRLRMLQGEKLEALEPLETARAMGEDGPGIRFMIAEAKRATRARVGRLAGHTAKLWDVVFSRDGSRIATASQDGTIRVWDPNGAPIATLDHHGAAIAIAFSPDGTLLAGGGRGGTVEVWRLADRRVVATLALPERVNSVEFSPDGAQLFAGTDNGAAAVLELATSRVTSLSGHASHVHGAYCATGACLVTWERSGRVIVWDPHRLVETTRYELDKEILAGAVDATGSLIVLGTAAGELVFVRPGQPVVVVETAHDNLVLAVGIAPRGEVVASASADGTARLWSASGKILARLVGHHAKVIDVRFSPRGDLVATASADGTARLWSATTGLLIGELGGHTSDVNRTAFDPQGTRIVTASSDHDALLWDVERAEQFRQLPAAQIDTSTSDLKIRYAPSGTVVAMIDPQGTVSVGDASTGETRCRTKAGKAAISTFGWSGDGSMLASIEDYGPVVRVWDARTCALLHELSHPDPVFAFAFTANRELVTGGPSHIVRRWSVSTERVIGEVTYPGAVLSLEAADDGRTLLATTFDPTDLVMQAADLGAPPRLYEAGSRQPLTGVYWDRARHHLLASSFDQYVRVWDEEHAAPFAKLEGTGPLWGLALHANTIVALGGVAPSLWNATTIAPLGQLEGHTEFVVGGALVTGGLLVTVSRDKTARIWDVEKRRELEVIPGASAMAVSQDGTSITFGDPNGTRSWSPSF